MNNYCDYITADLLKELIDHNFPAYKYSVGGIGTQVRNHIREKFPVIDDFMTYQEFEDYTTDIVIKIIEN